ncbi:MAG: rRNA pseudouridine synthase [Actinobacteria bacterium]|nr:rRNA pseudouridine synthase [Actinomycetota bacterium]
MTRVSGKDGGKGYAAGGEASAGGTAGLRLQKFLAEAGLGSRRRCERLIEDGRVAVNGRTARLGDRVDPQRDRVTVDGIPVSAEGEKKYFLLFKPPGYITTVRDNRGRPTVMDLVHEEGRLFPVGRLDKDTRGLLLITNDGYLAHKLLHPSRGVEKTYLVQAEGYLTPQGLSRLRKGIRLEEGTTAPAKVRVLAKKGDRCLLEFTLHEGKKRQIRRMCAAVGLEVRDLIRTRFGPLDLRGVKEGEYRPLTPEEVRELMEMD